MLRFHFKQLFAYKWWCAKIHTKSINAVKVTGSSSWRYISRQYLVGFLPLYRNLSSRRSKTTEVHRPKGDQRGTERQKQHTWVDEQQKGIGLGLAGVGEERGQQEQKRSGWAWEKAWGHELTMGSTFQRLEGGAWDRQGVGSTDRRTEEVFS